MLKIDPRNIIPITEARSKLSELISQTENDKVSLVTKRGKPAAVLLDPTYFAFLRNKLERLSWSEKFDVLLKKSRKAFNKYLKQQGYDPEELTEEEVREIIAKI